MSYASRILDLSMQSLARGCGHLGLGRSLFRTGLQNALAELHSTQAATKEDVRQRTIHFVCQGNIMRSAYAEQRLKQLLQARHLSDFVVRSSGTATGLGKAADPRAREMARRRGVSLEEHRTQPIDQPSIDGSWLIFTMDRQIQGQVVSRFPQSRGRTVLLGAFLLEEGEGPFIRDPYTRDEVYLERCFELIDRALTKFVDELAENLPETSRPHSETDITQPSEG